MKYAKFELIMKKSKVHESKFNYRIESPGDIMEFARKFLKMNEFPEERFIEIVTDVKGRIIGYCEIAKGDLCSTVVHPREVFKPAMLQNAAAVILLHNHPSGITEPSQDDVETTERLVKCGDMLGIKVLDHIIIGDDCRSLKADGLM